MRQKRGLFGLFSMLLCVCMVFSACSTQENSTGLSVPLTEELNARQSAAPQSEGSATLALLTTESRSDTPFGQSVRQAMSRFAGEQGLSFAVYKTGDEESDAQATLDLAITGGAAAVVSIGQSASTVCAAASAAHPGVAFILLDMPPENTAPLATNLRVDALSTGWMAGYAAVSAGVLDIGCTWQTDPESLAWAFGFMAGMNEAAQNLNDETVVSLHPAPLLPDGDTTALEEMLLARPRLVMAAVPQWESVSDSIGTAYSGRVFAPQCQEDVPAGKLWAMVEAEPSLAVTEALAQWREGRHNPRQQVSMNPAEGSVQLKTGLGNTSQSVLDNAELLVATPGQQVRLQAAVETWLESFFAGEASLAEMLPNIDVFVPPDEMDGPLSASIPASIASVGGADASELEVSSVVPVNDPSYPIE